MSGFESRWDPVPYLQSPGSCSTVGDGRRTAHPRVGLCAANVKGGVLGCDDLEHPTANTCPELDTCGGLTDEAPPRAHSVVRARTSYR